MPEGEGILCPKCEHPKSEIIDVRNTLHARRRRRRCSSCRHTYTTREILGDTIVYRMEEEVESLSREDRYRLALFILNGLFSRGHVDSALDRTIQKT